MGSFAIRARHRLTLKSVTRITETWLWSRQNVGFGGCPMPIFMLALLALVTFLCMFVLCVVAVLAESRQRRRMAEAASLQGEPAQAASAEPDTAEAKPKAHAAHA